MKFDGTFDVKAPREKVWGLISKPDNMVKCIPDLKEFEILGEDKFKASIKAGVGFIRGTLNFTFTLSDKTPQSHAKLSGHGTGTGSTVDLETIIDLSELPEGGTRMIWKAEAKIGGLIASVGQRLIEGVAQKTVTKLFDALKEELEN